MKYLSNEEKKQLDYSIDVLNDLRKEIENLSNREKKMSAAIKKTILDNQLYKIVTNPKTKKDEKIYDNGTVSSMIIESETRTTSLLDVLKAIKFKRFLNVIKIDTRSLRKEIGDNEFTRLSKFKCFQHTLKLSPSKHISA